MSGQLYDEGLQPERTELAWQRTLLAFGVAALLGFRLLSEALGDPAWSLPALFSIVLVGSLWFAARRRSVRTNAALLSHRPEHRPSGVLLLTVALLATGFALCGLIAITVLILERG